MKIYLMLICLILMAGCAKPMTNEEIIKEITICRNAGLDSISSWQGWPARIVNITCWGKIK